MALSIRIPPEDAVLLDQAVEASQLSKSEFVRRSIVASAQQVLQRHTEPAAAIDARWIGQGGGLRDPASVASPQRRKIVERLRAKHGYAG